MQQARMLGNYVENMANSVGLSVCDISQAIHCSEDKVKSFLKGRTFLSFEQLTTLSDLIGVSFPELIRGDEKTYNATVVHCMNEFDDPQKREEILDLIDDYLDVVNSLNA